MTELVISNKSNVEIVRKHASVPHIGIEAPYASNVALIILNSTFIFFNYLMIFSMYKYYVVPICRACQQVPLRTRNPELNK